MRRVLLGVFAFLFSHAIFASGSFFNVSASGAPTQISVTLCLDSRGPFSCQTYSVSAQDLSILTTVPNHTYPFAGIKINTPNYTISGVQCAPTGNGYCKFSVSDTSPTNITINSTASTYTIGGSLSGLTASGLILQNNGADNLTVSSGASSFQFATPVVSGGSYSVTVYQQPTGLICYVANASGTNVSANVTNVSVSCSTQNAYVANNAFSGGDVYLCSLNSDGNFNTCATTPTTSPPAWGSPTSIAFATVSDVPYAYVAANNEFSAGSVFYCTTLSNGNFDTCNTTPASPPSNWEPSAVAINTAQDGHMYAYVAQTSSTNSVYRCPINSDGSLGACATTGPTSGWVPTGITFATTGTPTTQYAYIGSGGTLSKLEQCTLNNDGTFNTCAITPTSGAPSWTPFGITFGSV